MLCSGFGNQIKLDLIVCELLLLQLHIYNKRFIGRIVAIIIMALRLIHIYCNNLVSLT